MGQGIDDVVPVTAAQQLASTQITDSQGRVVEVEKVAITDGGNGVVVPLSEATGQLILAELQVHTALLKFLTGQV